MRAKVFLMQFQNLGARLQALRDEYKQIQQDILTLKAIDYSGDKVQSSKHVDLSDKIVKLEKYRDTLQACIDTWIAKRIAVSKAIDKIPDSVLSGLLRERYINCKDWVDVGVAINRSRKQIWLRLHREALKEFDKVLQGNTK